MEGYKASVANDPNVQPARKKGKHLNTQRYNLGAKDSRAVIENRPGSKFLTSSIHVKEPQSPIYQSIEVDDPPVTPPRQIITWNLSSRERPTPKPSEVDNIYFDELKENESKVQSYVAVKERCLTVNPSSSASNHPYETIPNRMNEDQYYGIDTRRLAAEQQELSQRRTTSTRDQANELSQQLAFMDNRYRQSKQTSPQLNARETDHSGLSGLGIGFQLPFESLGHSKGQKVRRTHAEEYGMIRSMTDVAGYGQETVYEHGAQSELRSQHHITQSLPGSSHHQYEHRLESSWALERNLDNFLCDQLDLPHLKSSPYLRRPITKPPPQTTNTGTQPPHYSIDAFLAPCDENGKIIQTLDFNIYAKNPPKPSVLL